MPDVDHETWLLDEGDKIIEQKAPKGLFVSQSSRALDLLPMGCGLPNAQRGRSI